MYHCSIVNAMNGVSFKVEAPLGALPTPKNQQEFVKMKACCIPITKE